MSNYDLRAEVNRLSNVLNSIERENNELRSEISQAVYGVNQAERELSDYNKYIRDTLDRANGSINYSINRTLEAYEVQGEIDKLYTRFKAIELANKNIRALNNKKYYDFKNFRNIRKIVRGMMDNLDLNMVKDSVIYKSVEKQHLLTPDYWLTSVLISIMAWRSDEKELADRAVRISYNLDKKNSSIFYMIFNMRMGRNEAAVKWFLEYQNCELKGSDENTFLMLFSLISKTLSDNVDEETSRLISDFINKLLVERAEKEGYSEDDVINLIVSKLVGMAENGNYEFPNLSKYCLEYNDIRNMLNLAYNNTAILEFILKVVNVSVVEKNTYLKEYLNDLLEAPNKVERDTYDQIEYNELVIKLKGDVNSAKETFNQRIAHRAADFNIIETLIEWVYDLGNENVNDQMRLNMFTLIKTIQEKACDRYFDRYRSMNRSVRQIAVQDYSSYADFSNKSKEFNNVEMFYQDKQNQELSRIKNIGAYLTMGGGIACGIASFFTSIYLLAGVGIGGLLGAGMLVSNFFKRKNVVLMIQSQKAGVIATLNKMFSEYDALQKVFIEFDCFSGKIKEELAKL